jgi:hypothetical protein
MVWVCEAIKEFDPGRRLGVTDVSVREMYEVDQRFTNQGRYFPDIGVGDI